MKKKFYLSLLFLAFCVLTSLPMQGQDTIHYGDSNSRYLISPIVIRDTDEVGQAYDQAYYMYVQGDYAGIQCNDVWGPTSRSYYHGYVVDEPTMIYGIASTQTKGHSPLTQTPLDTTPFAFDLYAMLGQKEGGVFHHIDSVKWRNQRQYRYFSYPQLHPVLPDHDTVVGAYEFYFTTPRLMVDTFYVGMWFTDIDCETEDPGWRSVGWSGGCLNGRFRDNLVAFERTGPYGFGENNIFSWWGGLFPIIVPPDTDSFDCPMVQNLRVVEYRDGRPMFNWDRAGGQQPFQIAFGPADEDPDSYRVVTAASPPYLLPDLELDSTVEYAARCRGRCHHTCVIHDTILWSEWSDTIHFTIGRDTPEGIVPVERGEVAFALSPNPAKERVTVAIGEDVGMPCTVVLRDEQGRELLRQRMEGRELTLSTRGLATGVCLVTVESPRGSSTQKLVVEN